MRGADIHVRIETISTVSGGQHCILAEQNPSLPELLRQIHTGIVIRQPSVWSFQTQQKRCRLIRLAQSFLASWLSGRRLTWPVIHQPCTLTAQTTADCLDYISLQWPQDRKQARVRLGCGLPIEDRIFLGISLGIDCFIRI